MARRILWLELALAALISAIALAFGIQHAGIASGYVDPILKAGAQDEAVYGHAAAAMVRGAGWLTPTFLGRFMLNKPPLLMWLGAVAMRVFGVNSVALRLAPIGAGVACCLVVFVWLRRSVSLAAAASGVLLLLGSGLFHSMARKFMTDILLTLFVTGAIFVLSRDLRLERMRTALIFGVLSGAAILTKSAAGIIPLLILLVYRFALKDGRLPLPRVAVAAGAALVTAAPWHLYQFLVHRDWFLAEYIRFQLLGSGINAPSRYTSESNLSFYAWRLIALDPILLALAVAAGIFWKRAENDEGRLIAIWCAAAFLCPLAFGTRVAYYLLPLVPAMVVMAVRFSPLFDGRRAVAMVGLLAVALGLKAVQPDATWGLDYRRESVPSAAALEKYSQLGRANDLVIVAPDDEFYSAMLDLPKVRYAYLGNVDPSKTTEFFYWLGINVAPRDFCNLNALTPVYAEHLTEWGLRDTKPVGMIIAGASGGDLSAIVRCSPDRDFFLPENVRETAIAAGGDTHTATSAEAGRCFLLAKKPRPGPISAVRNPRR
jgi:hypothetical protein